MDLDENWWKLILQTSRTFLNQTNRDQTAGKPKFKGQKIQVNPENLNDYFHVSVGCTEILAFPKTSVGLLGLPGGRGTPRPRSGPGKTKEKHTKKSGKN